jgi:hypothetical protein
MKKLLSATVAICAAISATAYSQFQQYDGFAYTTNTTLAGNGTWSNVNTGTAPIIVADSLTVSGLQAPTGNKVSWDAGNIQEAINLFGATNTTGATFFSFAFQLTSLPTATTYSFGLAQNTTTYGATVWLRADGSGFNVGVNKGTTATNAVYAPGTLSLNTTYFLVGSYEFVAGSANDIASLWINPDSSTFDTLPSPSATITSTNSGGDISGISGFLLRGANGSPAGLMDELRIGTDWADVTPVPEPSTYAMLALAGVALAGYAARRRRRN